MLRFFILFTLILVALFGLELLQPVQQFVVLPWTSLLAKACVELVSLFDSSAMAQGKVLWNSVTGFGVSIEPGCNGVEAFVVLCAAIGAFPAGYKHKLLGLVAGFVAIQVLNVVRIISLFYLGQWNMDVFNFAHTYLWQALIMLDVLAVWLIWMRALASKTVPSPTTSPAVI
jgi:exosortase H (IPTLxxWG-CTERM-specific)